jgi:hypothetical protein
MHRQRSPGCASGLSFRSDSAQEFLIDLTSRQFVSDLRQSRNVKPVAIHKAAQKVIRGFSEEVRLELGSALFKVPGD